MSSEANGAVDMRALRRRSVRGGAVTMASKMAVIVIQLASTFILSRLLVPEDFGLIAMITAVTAFAGLFRDLGLSSAAVQKKGLTNEEQSNLFWMNLVLGGTLTAVVAGCSPLVAAFYGQAELVGTTLALSSIFVIGSLGSQHRVSLMREMRFAPIEMATVTGHLVGVLLAVSLAFNGFGYWSLVWGTILTQAWSSVALMVLSPFRVCRYSKSCEVGGLFKFGAHITTFEILNYIHRNLDNILIGRLSGPVSLGIYNRAYQLLMLPIQAFRGPVNSVAFPALSRLSPESAEFRTYYRRIASLLGLASMPMTAFFFLSAEPLSILALGSQWGEVAPIFSILAMSAFIQPVASLRGVVLLSSAQSRRYSLWGLINTVCVAIAFGIGIKWGPKGIATSYAIVNYALLVPSLCLCFKGTSVTVGDFFRSISRPASASLVSALVTYACLGSIPDLSDPVLVSVTLLLFVTAFAAIYFVFPGGRGEIRSLINLVSESVSRQQA